MESQKKCSQKPGISKEQRIKDCRLRKKTVVQPLLRELDHPIVFVKKKAIPLMLLQEFILYYVKTHIKHKGMY